MAASANDLIKKVGASTTTTLAAPGKAMSATSITVGSTTNWPTDTGVTFAIRTVDSDGVLVPGTYTEWKGTVTSGTTLAFNATPEYGSDQVYAAGSTTQVFIPVSSTAHNDLVDALINEHSQLTGAHTDITADSIKVDGKDAWTPTGMVTPFAGASAPTDWLMCDGSAVSRTTYADLFALVSTMYGAGDGSTTFNVPDLRSRMPLGVGTGTWSFTFASTDVNTGTDQIAVTASNNLKTGRLVRLTTTGTLPTGLSLATDYYLIVIDTTHVKLATSVANALFGTAINLTAAGSGTNTATGTLNARALAEVGGSEEHYHTLSPTNAGAPFDLASNQTNVALDGPSFNVADTNEQTGVTWGGGAATINTSLGLRGAADPYTGLPPFLALNYIIKT